MVVYEDPEAAKAAINWFNGTLCEPFHFVYSGVIYYFTGKDYCGRSLKVEFATYLEPVGGFGRGGGGGRGGFRGGGGGGRGGRGDGGFRGRGRGGEGGFGGRGGGQPNYTASDGDWICPDPQ